MSKKDLIPGVELETLHERVVATEEEDTTEDLVMARLYIREFDEKMITDAIALSMVEGKKEIYMCSPGGFASAATILIDLINEQPQNYTIKVSEQIMSAAFLTIINAKCKVKDLSSNMNFFCAYMHHNASLAGGGNRHVRKLSRKANEDMFNAIAPVLTDKQVKHYKRCTRLHRILPFTSSFVYEDLYLSKEQVKELLGDRYEY